MKFPFHQESLPLICDADGVIRVGQTRVPLDTVIGAFRTGATPEEIAQQYPSLLLADIYQVIGYCLHNPAAIDEYLSNREIECEEIRLMNESRFDPNGIRDRLLSRLSKPVHPS